MPARLHELFQGGQQPSPCNRGNLPGRATLVFALGERLARRGATTSGEAWPEAEFHTVAVPIHGPGATRSATVRLAEKRVQLKKGPEVRQIRRLLESGRQVPLITTHSRMPVEQIAGALFSRWSQENFFKYMREEFNLDALVVRGLEPQDPEARVVNPRWRAIDRNVSRFRQRLGTLRNRIADLARGAQSHQTAEAARRLQARIDALDAEREALKQKRSATQRHITVAELDEHQALDALPEGEKLLLDVIRIRLPRRNPHDACRRTGTGQDTATPQAPARDLPIRRRHHPGAHQRHPPHSHPRHRQRRRRVQASSRNST